MSQHYYRAYGLNISAELPLPELFPALSGEDVSIRFSNLQRWNIAEPERCKNHWVAPGKLLVNIPGVARYLVSHGKEILMDADSLVEEKQIRLYLLGSAFNALLHQRGYLPIHGNGIQVGDHCSIFAGHSGRGKSTLAAAFARAGYQILNDDLCAVNLDEKGTPWVQPGNPHIKLWQDALEHLGRDPAQHERVHAEEEKYRMPVYQQYCHHPLPLKAIYALHFHDQPGIRLQSLNKVDAVIALKNYTHRHHMAKTLGLEQTQFQQRTRLLASVPVYRLFRPKDISRLDEWVEYMVAQVLI